MNRRELLKRLSAVPFLGVLVPVAAKPDRVYLPSRLHEADVPGHIMGNLRFKSIERHSEPAYLCVNGHPWCNRCVPQMELSEESLERLCKQITAEVERTGKPIAVRPTHVHVRLHQWRGDSEICQHCGCSALDVEEGIEPLYCWRNRG